MALRGKVELLTPYRVKGWAWDSRTPTTPVSLIVSANDEMVGRVLANQRRKNLKRFGPDGAPYGFDLHLSSPLPTAARHVVDIRRETDGAPLGASPYVLEASTAFDDAARGFIGEVLASVASAADIEQRLAFLATQASRLRRTYAERFSGAGNARLERRLGWLEPEIVAEKSAARPREPRRPRALVIDKLAPTPNHDAGSNAILSHIRSLQRLGYDVTFAPLSLKADVETLEAESVTCCLRPWYETIEDVLVRQKNAFALVYLHRLATAGPYGALVRHHQPRARIVYSVADLHFLRLARQAEVEQRPELRLESRRTRSLELNAAAAADAVITHSSFEAEILRRSIPAGKVHAVPWAVTPNPVRTAFGERRGLAFVGGYAHKPNVDAALWLVEAVMPELAKLDPAIGCLIVGSAMPEALRRLGGGVVEAVGQVADLSEAFERVRLTIAPLAYGAGAKGKVLDSLAAGVPCLCSPAAAEGLDLPQILLDQVASTPADFARSIKALHDDEDLNRACAEAGLAYIRAVASEPHVDALMRNAVAGAD